MCLFCPNVALIQTAPAFSLLSLSECCPPSDNIRFFFTCRVRMLPLFRQHSLYLCLACPNEPLIQTAPAFSLLVLSEYLSYSDSIHSFFARPVRMYLSFSQHPLFLCSSCPNGSLIQTLSALSLLVLSEWIPHSDSLPSFFASPVRMDPTFRQHPLFLCLSCPNESLIQTLSALSLLVLSE